MSKHKKDKFSNPLPATAVEQVFQAFSRHNPEPKTELIYKTEFQLLMAVVLSAQAQDKVVNQVCRPLFEHIFKAADLLELSEEKLASKIKRIGLYRTKAKNLLNCARILVTDYKGAIPQQRKLLEALPGVGQKTAAVLMNSLFKAPLIAVDTHVYRVSHRLGLVFNKNLSATEEQLLSVVPQWAKLKAHHWLVLHGRYICQARKPLCADCFLQDWCHYFQQKLA